jgi:ATP:cob(I)alamin adenosyltransferase
MTIYTKKGDAGTTSLVGGVRVEKSELRVDSYGTIDELNAAVSFACKSVQDHDNAILLETIQHQLFYLSAEVASIDSNAVKKNQIIIELKDINNMEQAIDRCMAQLPPITSFVLPGTYEVGSRLHIARTIARRAERRLVALAKESELRPILLKYMNRLSDLFYALARFEDQLCYTNNVIEQVVEQYSKAMSTQNPSIKEQAVETDISTLDFVRIHTIMKQAVDKSIELKVPVTISLVDEHTNLIMTYRMPEALLISTELAPKKAYTSVALKCATHQISSQVQPGQELYQLETSCQGKIVTFGGGLPLYYQHKIIGAIGISGGSVQQDIQIAKAAINNLDLEEK